ncbi:hypothetical protein [Rhodohalobacter sp. 614A]|uniref:hypothetical protein n=1 Tax=Rhodohalobacter sp. 614A TaxID=2908649 RepID=UPI001F3C6A00|nr:hypothetical protein [Rhodohalobacter sp. 614A]
MMITLLFLMGLFLQSESEVSLTKPVVEETGQDSIKTEIVLRSEDLIWKSDWSFFSIDRMSYKVNSGYYGYYGPQPTYILDGIPFDPTFFGMNFSQLLPVSFGQIQKVDMSDGIGMYSGINYSSGLINLKSVPVQNGLSVFVSGQYGHNSDEPGPWVFDEQQVTPNVERFGPWVDAGASLKFGNWYAKGVLRTHRNLNINPHVQTRIKNLIGFPLEGRWPDAEATTHLGLVETGIQSNRVDLKIHGIRSESEEFLYFQPLAREVPTDFTTEQYSASGSFFLNNSFGIRSMAQYKDKATEYRRNQFNQDFDWKQTTTTGRISVFLNRKIFRFDIGSEYQKVETKASGLTEEDQQFVDLFVDQLTNVTSRLRFGSYSAITFHDDQKPIRARGFLEFDLIKGWTTSFEGSYSELLPEVSNPISEWISGGYDIMSRLDSYVFVTDDISNTRLYSLSNRHELQFSNLVGVHLKAEYLNHLNVHVPFQDARYYIQLSTLPTAYFLFDNQSGQRLKLSMDTELNWSDSFRQTFGIHYSHTLDGDVAYKSYWKTIPEYLLRHSTILNPSPDLEIRLNIQYQTKTVWDEFRRLDGKLNRTFHPQFPYRLFTFSNEVPAGINIDLVLSKWFWQQRIRTVFMLSNLFNQKYRTHPIGSEEGFGYMLRLELRI